MPCYDPPRPEDEEAAKRSQRHESAKTAILCGLLASDSIEEIVWALADAWCKHHKAIDELRAAVKYDFQDKRIEAEAEKCRVILDMAYDRLCT